MPEYASRGLLGVLTPQANTTVEPEMGILLPPGVAMVSARLVSEGRTIGERLQAYATILDQTLERFSNAPIDAYALATTGVSYLLGPDRETSLVAEIKARRGKPFVTAGRAIVDALHALEARTIGLVSPYPDELTQASTIYWQDCGFKIAEVALVHCESAAFHPIYALSSSHAGAAIRDLQSASCDAIVLLGTGMPTLTPIAEQANLPGPPVLSSILALAWRAVGAIEAIEPADADLTTWLSGENWRDRLRQALI